MMGNHYWGIKYLKDNIDLERVLLLFGKITMTWRLDFPHLVWELANAFY